MTSRKDPLATEPPSVPLTLGILASGNLAGAIAGLTAGGVGSRLAMRILALTSPRAQGSITEAQEVCRSDHPGGDALLACGRRRARYGRRPRPCRYQALATDSGNGLVFGLLMFAVSGRLLVNPDNIDFVILDPAWLGITMFASLPILFGLLIVPLQAKLEPVFMKARSGFATALGLVAGLAPLAVGGPVTLILVVLIAGGFLLARFATVRELVEHDHHGHLRARHLGGDGNLRAGVLRRGALEILV